jgi:hypothetical protein
MVVQEPSDAGCDPRTLVERSNACQEPRREALSALMVRYTAQVLGFVLRARAEALFTRHGGKTILLGRFVGSCGRCTHFPPGCPSCPTAASRRTMALAR